MLEKQIEAAVCRYARDKGILAFKFTSPARAAVPDRLFITPSGDFYFIEFQRTGQKPTPAQEREHTRLRAQNVRVYVVDNVQDGKNLIDANAGSATRLPKKGS
jgi:hypothetical protein